MFSFASLILTTITQIISVKKNYLLLAILAAGMFSAQTTSTGTPAALKSTSGIGLHKNRIWWINWDLNNNKAAGDNLVNGATTTFTSPAGFIYKLTISNVKVFSGATAASPIGTEITSGTNRVLYTNTPTSWSGNNFPTAYSGFKDYSLPTPTNVADNNAIITTDNLWSSVGGGNRVTYRLTVEATDPLGAKGNATGIVLAGSESLNGTGEWYSITAPQGRIRYIDKYIRSSNSWTNYSVQLRVSNGSKKVFVTNPGGGDTRGDAMLFAEDVPYVDAEVKGGSGQSIAIGFLEELDYSDAPTSYGLAYHLFENKFTGGIFPDGNKTLNTANNVTDLASATGELAKFFEPTLRLGASIDSEDNPFNSTTFSASNANWDDTNGTDDEDALSLKTSTINDYMRVAYVNISPLTSYMSLWIDANKNGAFDANEKLVKTIPPNKTGNAIFDLTTFSKLTPGSYYARIRYSSAPNLGPTGYAPDGEVEDHLITVNNNIYNILGTIYQDNDGGIPNGTPMYQTTVNLYDSSGNLVESTLSNYEGQYMFTGLTGGNTNYTVQVVAPTSYQHVSSTDTTPLDGTTEVSVNGNNVTGINFGLYFDVCYKTPPTTTGGLPTIHGITNLGRAGANNGNWPMIRTGAWTALESKTKGFVINRVAANYEPPLDDGQVPQITNPVKGMIIYDTNNHCLKMYDGTTWKCIKSQACPPFN